MASNILQRVLRELCATQGWTYAVFWRLRKRLVPRAAVRTNRMRLSSEADDLVLMWEDGYLSSVSQVADYCQSQEVLVQGSIDYGLLQASYSKLSYQIYNVGEGLIGISVGNNTSEWVHKDGTTAGTYHYRFSSLPSGWSTQFAAGINTIAIIPVAGGALQLGSVQFAPEDPRVVTDLRRKFHLLEKIPGIFLSDMASSGLSSSPFDTQPVSEPVPAVSVLSMPSMGNVNGFPFQWQEQTRLARNESSDSSAAADLARFAAQQLSANAISPGSSCLTSPNRGTPPNSASKGQKLSALTPFQATEEEQQFAEFQFKLLSSNGAQPAGVLRKSHGARSDGQAGFNLSPSHGVKRTHHGRSASMPLFSDTGFQVSQPKSGVNSEDGRISMMVSQLKSSMVQKSPSDRIPHNFSSMKPELVPQGDLRMRVLPPLDYSLPSAKSLAEAELLQQLRVLDEKQRQGALSEEVVEALLSKLEEKANKLGLLGSVEESVFSPARNFETVKNVQMEVEAQSGMPRSDTEELQTFLEGFDLGVELPSPRPPPAKRISCKGLKEDKFVPPMDNTPFHRTLMNQIEELRSVVPGAPNSDLGSLLQQTVNFISDSSKQDDTNDSISLVLHENGVDFSAGTQDRFMDGVFHALV